MKRPILLLMVFFPSILFAQNPNAVKLKQWLGVIGNMNGERLGGYVLGLKPGANLPYRAAVSWYKTSGDTSADGYTSFFKLQSTIDTIPQLILYGTHPLVGDFNGDGFQDVAVVSGGWGPAHLHDTVYVYWGTATGIDTVNPLKIPEENYLDGIQPACVGDVNNDGKVDLILTAPLFPNGGHLGKVYIFLNPVSKSTPDYTIVGDTIPSLGTGLRTIGEELGVNCALADLNNDGYQDLIVRGERGLDSRDTSHFDYINIYWGTGINSPPDITHPLTIRDYPPSANNMLGLACFDVNGDGIPDLVWTTEDSVNQSVHLLVDIHYGGNHFGSVPNVRIKNPGVGFGNVLANGGDMNGRGYNDLIVSGETYTAGLVFVYSGGPKMDTTYDAAVGVNGIYHASSFGGSVACVGDVNGDGLSDIIVGAGSYPSFEFHDTQGFFGIFLGDSAIPTSVKEHSQSLPNNFRLYQAYPNPFNPTTTISYSLPAVSYVTLRVYDVIGREVKTLVEEVESPGWHEAKFDGTGLSSGMYFYRLAATVKDGTTFIQIKKATLIK